MLFAFDGERVGFARSSAEKAVEEKEPIRIGIAVPRTLDVFVEDRGGAPLADAYVSLESEVGERWYTRSGGATDDNGYVALYFANLVGNWSSLGHEARAAVRNLGSDVSEVALDMLALPSEPITLVANGGVKLRAHLVDDGGLPYMADSSGMRFKLEVVGEEAPAGAWADEDWVEFSRVSPGAQVRLSLAQDAPRFWSAEAVEFDVKPDADGIAKVDFPLSYSGTVFRGRLVDGDGEPVAKAEISGSFSIESAAGSSGSGFSDVRTDALGRFSIPVQSYQIRSGGATAALMLIAEEGGDSRTGMSPDFAGQLTENRIELGDIVMGDATPQVAGIVVDERGEPVSGAGVEVGLYFGPMGGRSLADKINGNVPPGPTVWTDEAGRFHFSRDMPPMKCHVRAMKARLVTSPWTEAGTGDLDLRLVVQRGGGIRGKAGFGFGAGWRVNLKLVEPDVAGTKLPDELVPMAFADRNQEMAWDIEQDLEAGETFGWVGVPAGLYRVTVRQRSSPKPALVIDDLRVVAGETLEDGRLGFLELESLLPSVTLTLFGPDGLRLGSDVRGLVGMRVGKRIQELDSLWEDKYTVTPPALPVDLVLRINGYGQADVKGVSADMDVYLESAPTVRLRLPVAPPAGWRLAFSIAEIGGAPWQSRGFFGGSLVHNGACTEVTPTEHLAEFPGPGKYSLSVAAFRVGEPLLPSAWVKTKQVIEVVAGQLESEVVVDVTSAQIAGLCKE